MTLIYQLVVKLNSKYQTRHFKMKIHQTFRLDEEIIESAIKYSKSENRTLSNVYETAVIEYLKSRGKKIKKPSTK